MLKLLRIGIGVTAACLAGLAVYGYLRARQRAHEEGEPGTSGGNLIMFPAERPPFAEAAEQEAAAE